MGSLQDNLRVRFDSMCNKHQSVNEGRFCVHSETRQRERRKMNESLSNHIGF